MKQSTAFLCKDCQKVMTKRKGLPKDITLMECNCGVIFIMTEHNRHWAGSKSRLIGGRIAPLKIAGKKVQE